MKPRRVGLVALFLVGACQSGTGDSSSVVEHRAPYEGPVIELHMDVPAQVRAGLPVLLRLTVRNVGCRTANLMLGPEKTTYNFVVRDASGAVVWTRADGRYRVNVGRQHFLHAGDSLVFRAVWVQQTRGGQWVRPGTYWVQGVLRATVLNNVAGLTTDTIDPLQNLPHVPERLGGVGVGTRLRPLTIVSWF